jgi:Holliday junction resolvase RusA-like endonuclease
MSIAFRLDFVPPRSTAQHKGAYALPGGRGVRFYEKAPQKLARHAVIALMATHAPREPMMGPLAVRLAIVWPWLKGDAKKVRALRQVPHDRKPDVDNSGKMILDAMTTLRFWEDDAQITALTLEKYRGDRPGIAVRISGHEPEWEGGPGTADPGRSSGAKA